MIKLCVCVRMERGERSWGVAGVDSLLEAISDLLNWPLLLLLVSPNGSGGLEDRDTPDVVLFKLTLLKFGFISFFGRGLLQMLDVKFFSNEDNDSF